MLNITHHQENTNQNYNEVSPHTCQNAKINNIGNNIDWQGCRERLLVGMQTGATTLENNVEVP